MINVLILGGGCSAVRFIESFLFNTEIHIDLASFSKKNYTEQTAKKYVLNCNKFLKITNFDKYDCIIISVPIWGRDVIYKKLNKYGYKGALIIEKPFALNLDSFDIICDMFERNNIVVPYSRRFYQKDIYSNVDYTDRIEVEWPIGNMFNFNVFYDILPHVIDWVCMIMQIEEKFNLIVIKVSEENIVFYLNDVLIDIKFIDTDKNYVTINNKVYNGINAYKSNNNILAYVLRQEKAEKEDFLKILKIDTHIYQLILEKTDHYNIQ